MACHVEQSLKHAFIIGTDEGAGRRIDNCLISRSLDGIRSIKGNLQKLQQLVLGTKRGKCFNRTAARLIESARVPMTHEIEKSGYRRIAAHRYFDNAAIPLMFRPEHCHPTSDPFGDIEI